MSDMTDLERFTRSVLDPSAEQPTEYDEPDEDLDNLDPEAEADAVPEGWQQFLNSLSPDEMTIAEGDPEWVARRFAAFEATGADVQPIEVTPTRPAEATLADGRPVVSGNDVVRWVNESAAQGLLPDGMSAETYIARLAGANRAAYRAFAFEAGLPPDSKPSYNSLSRGSQTEVMQAEVDSWTADTFRKRLG